MAVSNCAVLLIALAACLSPMSAEFISDLGTSPQDEHRALALKAEQFWDPVLEAAEKTKMEAYYTQEHQALYADVQKVLTELPVQNEYVREALVEALAALRSADAAVLANAEEAVQVASEKLAVPASAQTSNWNFLKGGQDFFRQVIKSFVNGGSKFPERLQEQVGNRQADVLPLLRGTQAVTGNVLHDCRTASRRSFDLLKYDIYNKGVPKTPEAAKAVANRLVDAAGDTRHRFMQGITNMANSIANDVKGRNDDPTVTVLRASLQSTPGLLDTQDKQVEAPLTIPVVLDTPGKQLEAPLNVGKPSFELDNTLLKKSGDAVVSSNPRMIYSERLVSL